MKFVNEILIVDDAPENIEYVELVLSEDAYRFTAANDGHAALQALTEKDFDLILLDVMMPEIDGFEVCRLIKQNPQTQDIPVIFLTARLDVDSITRAFSLGAVDYITKPFNAAELLVRVKNHIDLHNAKRTLKQYNLSLKTQLDKKEKRLLSEIEESQKEMIYALTEMIEATSDETGKHIFRVAEYARLLAFYHPALSVEDEEIIAHAAPMHDIGKIVIPPSILQKPARLNDAEFEVMKTHTSRAHDFFKNSQRRFMKAADIIAVQHHEKWNGNGYPKGLKGQEIHIYARIVALADVFDALTHKRQYKEAWSIEDAVGYIQSRRGIQFDPQLVDIFLENLEEFVAIYDKLS